MDGGSKKFVFKKPAICYFSYIDLCIDRTRKSNDNRYKSILFLIGFILSHIVEWGATSGFKTPHELSMDDTLFYSVRNTCTQNLFSMTDRMVYID